MIAGTENKQNCVAQRPASRAWRHCRPATAIGRSFACGESHHEYNDGRDMVRPGQLGEAMRRSLPRLAPGVRAEIKKLLTPEALAAIAAVLGLWVGSHFIGIGEIIDIILLAVGVLAIGLAVFDGVGELAEFSRTALGAGSEQDLDRASIHFANAVTILGIQAVLAVLFRGAPRTYSGRHLNVGPAPTVTVRRAYRPVLRSTRNLPAGFGRTTPWGDILISRLGTSADRRLVALHENVHRVAVTQTLFPARVPHPEPNVVVHSVGAKEVPRRGARRNRCPGQCERISRGVQGDFLPHPREVRHDSSFRADRQFSGRRGSSADRP